MIRLLLLLTLATGVLPAIGQTRKGTAIQRLFDTAEAKINDSLFTEAIVTYQQVLKKAKVNTPPYCKATYNIGCTYLMLKNDTAAKAIFLQVLQSSFNEMDKGGKGSGLMGEPYALYKHNSCENLAEIALREMDYPGALAYIRLFDKKYPYRHFCGNEMAASEIYTARMYARAYLGLKDTAGAMKMLLPYVFNNGLASNTEVIEDAIKLLQARYDKKFLARELDNAIDGLYAKQTGTKKYPYTSYQIIFMGITIDVTDVWSDTASPKDYQDKGEVEQKQIAVKNNAFYRKIAR